MAVYAIVAYDLAGRKDVLGLWMQETEGAHHWMGVFDELRQRGVEDVLFVSMDGVSGLADGLRAIFPDAVAQRCLVHLVRNSCKYVPSDKVNIKIDDRATASHPMPLPLSLLPRYRFFAYFG